jgi:hypothetical protein
MYRINGNRCRPLWYALARYKLLRQFWWRRAEYQRLRRRHPLNRPAAGADPMTASTGKGRGGPRTGSGRKPKNRGALPDLDIQHLLAEPVLAVIESAAQRNAVMAIASLLTNLIPAKSKSPPSPRRTRYDHARPAAQSTATAGHTPLADLRRWSQIGWVGWRSPTTLSGATAALREPPRLASSGARPDSPGSLILSTQQWKSRFDQTARSFRMISAARSPMMTQGAIVLPVVTFGIIEPSAIRSPSMP